MKEFIKTTKMNGISRKVEVFINIDNVDCIYKDGEAGHFTVEFCGGKSIVISPSEDELKELLG